MLAERGLSEEGEEILQSALEDVALRVSGGYTTNYAALVRENGKSFSLLLSGAGALLALFTVLMAVLLNSAISSRVRADQRTIAMLRAVARRPPLSGKSIPARRSPCCATVFCRVSALAHSAARGLRGYVHQTMAGSTALNVFAALLAAYAATVCTTVAVGLRARLRAALQRSIAEGIREL